jgi:hypothetical protein
MAGTRAPAPRPVAVKRSHRWRRRLAWAAAGILLTVGLLVALAQFAMRVEPGGMPALSCRPSDWRPCQVVDGRIVYLQRVDPDGDGDLHVLLLSRQSVTGPWLTMLKVPAPLRTGMDPGIGRWVRALGQRFRAEHGENSIRVARWAVAH